MQIETLTLGSLQTNCYLVWDEDRGEGVVIDPGDTAEFIAEKIQRLKFRPVAIVATHGHFDHNLAAGELQLMLNKPQIPSIKSQINNNSIPYYIHKNDLFLLKKINESARHWIGARDDHPLPQNIQFFSKNKFQISNFKFQIIHTPGHTPGSICLRAKFEIRDSRFEILFSGDTLFKDGIGRYDFSYSSRTLLERSLKRLMKLPSDTIVYPGHGEHTTIGDEKLHVTRYTLHE